MKAKKKKYLDSLLLLSLIILPILVYAKQDTDAEAIIVANHHFTELLAHLFPISLSPYLTLFVTSLLSKVNISSGFVSTHPLFNSWIVMGLSLTLFTITLIPKLFSKVAAPITLTANFLDNKASIIIVIIITVLPEFSQPETQENTAVLIKMGVLGDIILPFRIVLLTAVSIVYLSVVMTVRLFLEVLIMLSPIPLVDTVFEIAKIALTIAFILLGIFFPKFAFALSLFTFIISLLLYQRATRTIHKIKYLIIHPVIQFILRRKGALISEQLPRSIQQQFSNISLAIPVFNQNAVGKIPKNQAVWLIKNQDQLFLAKTSLFKGVTQCAIPENDVFTLKNNIMHLSLNSTDLQFRMLISKSYLSKQAELETIIGCQQAETANQQDKSATGFKRFLKFFDVKTVLANRKMLLGKE